MRRSEPFLSSSWHRVAGLKPMLRPHVRVDVHTYQGGLWYVLRDDLNNRVHRYSPAAYALVAGFDGARTVEDVWSEIVERMGDDAPSQDDAVRLLTQLHQQDLIAADVVPVASEGEERQAKQRRARRGRSMKNPLAITIPLGDPDRALGRITRALGVMPGWLLALAYAATVAPAVALAVLHWPDLMRASTSDALLSAQNLFLSALVFPLAKLIHEMAHGVAAKAFGGAVPEAGVMLLAFYPVPYVDVSSSQAFADKRQRALVAAAGMAAELVLAALALYVWLAAEPGALKATAFSVLVVCSISTVIVNGNPLLRYDGYFILCDLMELPNLATRATRWWGRVAERWLFGAHGRESDEAARGVEAVWFAFYAPAAFIYRMIVLFGVALFVASQYLALGVAAAIWSVALGLLVPWWKMAKHVATSPRLSDRRGRAVGVSLAGLAALAAAALMIPAPLHTVSEGVVWLPETGYLRAGAGGFVTAIDRRNGERVEIGDTILTLSDPLAAARLGVLRKKAAEVETRLSIERFGDQARAQTLRLELEVAKAEVDKVERDIARLATRAGAAGVLSLAGVDDLPGRFFKEGQVIGHVAPAATGVVRATVTQDDIDLVRSRLSAIRVRFADRPGETFEAKLLREIPAARDALPSRALSTASGGRYVTDPRDQEGVKTLNRVFQVEIAVASPPSDIAYGLRATLRFEHAWEPLAKQAERRLRQLFLAVLNG